VDDATIPPIHLIAYGGHGICMAFYGVTDGERGQMSIIETPDDASIRVERVDGRLVIVPEWDAQRGEFGYVRRLRHVFSAQGGHVAMAKRYRAYAQQTGQFKTLAEKRQSNPDVDRLIGAVNVWCWDRNAVSLVQELQAAGIERILWSNQQSPDNVRALNDLGVLTSRYDIYQDVMAPTNFARLQWIHPDWTTNAWPNDILRDRRGNWAKGWAVEAKDGGMIPCGVICDRQALPYARERIPADLATRPYRCRFIDTTTAAPWHECYAPDHPMTRTESRRWKMELLRYVCDQNRLVTGCETGHDAAVPFVHYFEGMLSLGPYRVPDAGRRMSEIWTEVPAAVAKFQLGHDYRLPLWELVYHDCVVAQWYWGDYNNKLPALWDKRDLFNVLYGTPPMFMFNRRLWEQNRARFVQSYRNTCPHVRQVGYQEMTDHRFLTPDRSVQQTVFANGVLITVNFGSADHRLPDGRVVPAKGFLTEGE
jgi:phage gp37-like protein